MTSITPCENFDIKAVSQSGMGMPFPRPIDAIDRPAIQLERGIVAKYHAVKEMEEKIIAQPFHVFLKSCRHLWMPEITEESSAVLAVIGGTPSPSWSLKTISSLSPCKARIIMPYCPRLRGHFFFGNIADHPVCTSP
jgi:hypothetical protein